MTAAFLSHQAAQAAAMWNRGWRGLMQSRFRRGRSGGPAPKADDPGSLPELRVTLGASRKLVTTAGMTKEGQASFDKVRSKCQLLDAGGTVRVPCAHSPDTGRRPRGVFSRRAEQKRSRHPSSVSGRGAGSRRCGTWSGCRDPGGTAVHDPSPAAASRCRAGGR